MDTTSSDMFAKLQEELTLLKKDHPKEYLELLELLNGELEKLKYAVN